MAWWWALECLGALAEPDFSWAEQGGAVTLSARASLRGGASGVVAEPWRREVMRCGSRTEVLSPHKVGARSPVGAPREMRSISFLPQPCAQLTEKR